jgi:hypothetical protein
MPSEQDELLAFQYSRHLEKVLARIVNIRVIIPGTENKNETFKKMRKYSNFQLKFSS